ncbi:MAG TPA: YihY/virulence factor BrkB family protein [Terracidiphilus sp.]|nr:YihY/virulence factor BrkB family protein [Terracidiphilus sp.]
MKKLKRIPVLFHRALLRTIAHDGFNLAQSSAYSAIVSLFPALIVAAAVISLLPYTAPVRFQLAVVFDRILPSDVSPMLQSYFVTSPHNPKSAHALIVALAVSITGASSVMTVLMEGVRRANELPQNCWTLVGRRLRAFMLVPLSLIPFLVASLLVLFGHYITEWIAHQIIPSAQSPLLFLTLIVRWIIALAASMGIVGLIYHMGTPMRQSWLRVVPGAILSTVMWFVTTLAFGWYVTRFANYSQVYGPLGAVIALLFWLYIISFSVLFGAEFNAEFNRHFFPHSYNDSTVSAPSNPPTRVE